MGRRAPREYRPDGPELSRQEFSTIYISTLSQLQVSETKMNTNAFMLSKTVQPRGLFAMPKISRTKLVRTAAEPKETSSGQDSYSVRFCSMRHCAPMYCSTCGVISSHDHACMI